VWNPFVSLAFFPIKYGTTSCPGPGIFQIAIEISNPITMRKTLFFLIIFCPYLVFAQKFSVPSVLITKSKDSVHVLTANRELTNPTSVKTLDPASGKYHTYQAFEIDGLVAGGEEYYKSAIVTIDHTPFNVEIQAGDDTITQSTDTVLLKREFESNLLRLYSYTDDTRTHLFLQKGDGPIDELVYRKYQVNKDGTSYENEDKAYIDQISSSLGDCPAAVSNIKYIAYTPQAIERIFDKYAKNCYIEMVTKYVKSYKAVFDISLVMGASMTNLHFTDAVYAQQGIQGSGGISPVAGMRFDYNPPLFGNKFSLVADVYYYGYTGNLSYYTDPGSSTFYTKAEYQLKNSYINLALALRYHFTDTRHTFRPFLNAGFLSGVVISSQNMLVTDQYAGGIHNISESDAFPNGGIKNMQFGYFGGAGLKYKRFSLEYRYHQYNNILNYTSKTLTSSSSNVVLTYKINK
jgi:hypothetical protein